MKVHIVATVLHDTDDMRIGFDAIIEIVLITTNKKKAVKLQTDMISGKVHPNDLNLKHDYDAVEVYSRKVE